jgi:hypothetical protein
VNDEYKNHLGWKNISGRKLARQEKFQGLFLSVLMVSILLKVT